jgi:predicted GNAT superfamily acetyltransferase
VAGAAQGTGVGWRLKMHQRGWAACRGLARITWTYDPLVRRNGWFNLVKLGARAVSYHPDFYGLMEDGINGGDPTDRCLVVWSLSEADPEPPAAGPHRLRCGPGGEPEEPGADPESPVLLCQVPDDAVELRRRDPAMGTAWRLALRRTMGSAMAAGYMATSMTPDGSYVLRRAT